MTILFAAAGMAEAEWAFGLLACWMGLFFIAGVDIAACVRRSWKLSLTAVVLLLLFSWTFSPWMVFEPIRPGSDGAYDSDVVYWSARFRSMAIAWCVEAVVTCAFLPATCLLERRRRRSSGNKLQANRAATMRPKTTSRVLLEGFLTLLAIAIGSLVLGVCVTFGN
jgi:hypothetical protein